MVRQLVSRAKIIFPLYLLSSHYINMKIIAAITLVALVVGVKSLPQLDFPHTQDYNESIPVPGDNETLLSVETRNALSLLSADEKQSMIDECVHALDMLKGNGISKRSTSFRDNSQFCCNKTLSVGTTRRQEVVRARTVTRTVYSGHSYRCRLYGIGRCYPSYSRYPTVITTTEYYVDYNYIEVDPVCPDANVVCCNGYVYYAPYRQCLTLIDLENLLSLIREYADIYRLLQSLSGSPSK
ncbi:hypothetical protein EB796_014537 [Bugula neritina]|uniref:Uncharacterized protein n=1 Tax=Bugula neritina TaxID=10212 RepID=A0A7J7JMR9_BUGNE|nr:hypothetical protein EB796_014537 [Bugula neritina]